MVNGDFPAEASSRWTQGTGPSGDIVISSRVRLARNLTAFPFPNRMNDEQGSEILKLVESGLSTIPSQLGEFELYLPSRWSSLQRQVLVERHLISPALAGAAEHSALVLSQTGEVSIMINEEDHLRLQCLLPGLQLSEAWERADAVDDALDRQLDFAFDEEWGYLTTCPTNVGTGLRASVMMHLPGLVLTDQHERVFSVLSKVGLVVRGLYGEGSKSEGNLFQVSNQVTLGRSEEDIISNLEELCRRIMSEERSARERILNRRRHELEDKVGRAYGILTNARSMSSQEAMRLLSVLRLGVDLNLISHVEPDFFNSLLIAVKPASLQMKYGSQMGPEERDRKRADLIRQRIEEASRT